jgi:hypothetical protein
VDTAVQQLKFPLFAFNNTYGIQAVDEGLYRGVTKRYNMEDGCGTVLPMCRALATQQDPENTGVRNVPVGGNDAANLCSHAVTVCGNVYGGFGLVSDVRIPTHYPEEHNLMI